ncbi:MAG: exopolysaccharide biosynthesis polyprenyl glycosylphosphotransferase [Bacteroidales bacterium]|nr:exopolysaccharide biosynthesis polyprenyl glycosylphosphotransferase [Bacteroidales bacterium]
MLGFLDISAITLSFQISYSIFSGLEAGLFFSDTNILNLYIIFTPLWLIILYLIKITEIPRTKRYSILFVEYLESTILFAILLSLTHLVFRINEVTFLFLLTVSFTGLFILYSVRLLEYITFKRYRSKGYNYRNLVIIADESAYGFINNIRLRKEWGYRVYAIFTESELLRKKWEDKIIMLSKDYIKVLDDLMEKDLIDEVLFYKSIINTEEVRTVIRSCEELGVTFRLRMNSKDKSINNGIRTDFAGENFLTFINVPYDPISISLKRFFDITISLTMLLVLAPFLLLLAVIIKLDSKGPVIFKQERVGLRGRKFMLYKFRTMVQNAEELRQKMEEQNEVDGPVFKIENDPRITRVGKFLRNTGFDEFPQLLNILKGEMSLIGPRPPIHSEIVQYKRWQLRRLSVKPGLSCFWQIKPERNSIKFETWMEMDLAYIDNWSLRLDFLILLRTFRTVVRKTGL